MNEHLEASFEKLSEVYLSKIAEERKRADEKQLAAINSSLREWASRIQQNDHSAHDQLTSSSTNEHDLIRGALMEAKERQGKVVDVGIFQNLSL
jgi:hypothetical protein